MVPPSSTSPTSGPIHADGRASRWVRWIDGVATVTDGHALFDVHHGDAAREWTFVIPRPSLVVADGPFVEAAWEAGVEVVAFAGLDRPALAIASRHHTNCLLVPLRTDRPSRNYHVVAELIRASERDADCEICASRAREDVPASRVL